ncbi:hypothetical protein LINPERHAP1_LOCUS5199 [Linum perenne]
MLIVWWLDWDSAIPPPKRPPASLPERHQSIKGRRVNYVSKETEDKCSLAIWVQFRQ